MLYRERMKQANREARATAIGVLVILVAWLAFGFGLYNVDIEIFSTPLWVVMGCLGTWIVAIIVSIILATKVIKDCPFDEDDFGREYQPEEAAPVEVASMTIDLDIIGGPEHAKPSSSKRVARKQIHPRKPIGNTRHHAPDHTHRGDKR